MAEIINLRQFRKAREKAEKAARAAESRLLFGRGKASKALSESRKAVDLARLEGHRLGEPEKE